jgi:hypothetical protein
MAQLQTTGVTGSLTVTGQIIAQSLNVQQVTSSIVYSSGSNRFGNLTSDIQQFTGSLRVTGSGNHWIVGGNVGIDTPSPTYKLQVNGTANGLYVIGANVAPFTQTIASFVYGGNNNSINVENQGGKASFQARDNASAVMDLHINPAGGNVGIGTTTPSLARLQVNGNIHATSFTGSFSGSVTAAGSNTQVIYNSSGVLAGSSNFVFNGSNVGIGTTTPTDLLHLYASGNDRFLKIENTSAYTGIWLQDSGANNGWLLMSGYTTAESPGDFAIREYGVQTSLTIKSGSGNIGIGTIAPNEKLHVAGNIHAYAAGGIDAGLLASTSGGSTTISIRSNGVTYFNGGNIGIGTTAPPVKLQLIGDGAMFYSGSGQASYGAGLKFRNDGYEHWTIGVKGSTFVISSTGANGTSIWAGASTFDRVTIASAGAVRLNSYGSGTNTGTVAYNLAVDSSGNVIETAGGVVDGSGTANYVPRWQDANTLTNSIIYDDGSYIGIGTTTTTPFSGLFPGKLVIEGGTGNVDGAFLSTNNTNAAELILSKRNPTNNFGSLLIQHSGSSGDAIAINYGVNMTTGVGGTNSFKVTTGGNGYFAGSVGIGTTAPTSRLHVSGGNIEISNGFGLYTRNSAAVQYPLILMSSNEISIGSWEGNFGSNLYLKGGNGAVIADFSQGNSSYFAIRGVSGVTPSEYFRLISNGNVGIGTTNPSLAKLQVSGNIHATSFTGSFSGSISSPGSNTQVIYNSSGVLAGSSNFVFDGTNVGIGATSPIARLHVGPNLSDYSTYSFTNTGAVIASFGVDNTAARTNVLSLMRDGTSGVVYAGLAAFDLSRWSADSVNARTQLDIRLANTDTNTITDVISLRSNGCVGIGTTAPRDVLDIVGSAILRSTYNLSWGNTYGAGVPTITGGSGSAAYLAFFPAGSTSNEKVRFDANGNVGIGTTAPGHMLDITTNKTGNGAGSTIRINRPDNASYENAINWATNGSSTWFLGSDNDSTDNFYLYNWRRSAFELTILSGSGNVGIGTSNPGAKLDIYDSNTTSGDRLIIRSAADNAGEYTGIMIKNSEIQNAAIRSFLLSGNSPNSRLGLFTGDNTGNALSEKFSILSNGYIGIGTTTPNKQLTFGSINEDAIQIRRLTTSEGNTSLGTGISWTWRSDSTDNETWAAIRVIMPGNSNSNMTFSTTPALGGAAGLVERMRIQDNGNIGIGTTSPSTKLHLYTTSNEDSIFRMTAAATGTEYDPVIQLTGQGNNIDGEGFELWYDNSVGDVHLSTTYNDSAAAIRFHTRTGASKSTSNERFTIAGDGNVGIGTITPTAKLQIVGTADSLVFDAYSGGLNGSYALLPGRTVVGTVGSGYPEIGYNFSTNNNVYTKIANDTAWGIGLGGSNYMSFKYAAAGTGTFSWNTAMAINLSGNVGIGTTNPSYKLDVNGDTRTFGYLIGVDNTAAIKYVFTNDGGNSYINSGNVGIGTTTPSQKLEIAGNISLTQGGNRLIRIGSATNYYYDIATSGDDFVINEAGATTRFVIKYPNGNIGIGTSSPNATLNIVTPSNDTTGDSFVFKGSNGKEFVSISKLGFIRSKASDTNGANIHFFDNGGTKRVEVAVTSTGFNWYSDALGGTFMIFQHTTGNIGIGTTSPASKLELVGDFKQRSFLTAVTTTLPAVGEQARQFEIARAFMDFNDWNPTGTIEIELHEQYYSRGLKKSYSVYWGYSDASGYYLKSMEGSGDNNFQLTIGSKVLVSGDIYYIPIYANVKYYAQAIAVIKTNRTRTTDPNSTTGGTIYINESPTGTDISSFTADSTVTISNYASKIKLGDNTTTVNIGTLSGTGNRIVGTDSSGDLSSITVGSGLSLSGGTLTATGGSAGTVTGTGASTQIAYWTSTSNVTGSNGLVFSGGNVGIGTTSPGFTLDAQGGGSGLRVLSNTSYVDLALSNTSTTSYIQAESNNLRFFVAGGSNSDIVMLLDGTNDRVGIGTLTPTGKLQINSNNTPSISGTDPTGALVIKSTASTALTFGVYEFSPFYGWLQMRHGTIADIPYPLSLQPIGGNVGIGITNPLANLDIKGVQDTPGQISLQLRSGNSAANFVSNQITFGYNNTDTYRHAIKTRHNSGATSGNAIDFYTWKYGTDGAADIPTQYVMSLNGASVGIGSSSPTSKLTVNGGSLGSTSGDRVLLQNFSTTTANVDDLEITNIRIGNGSDWYTSGNRIQQKVDGFWMGYIQFNGGNHSGISIGTGLSNSSPTSVSERFRITDVGNIGINETSPVGKLTISNDSAGSSNLIFQRWRYVPGNDSYRLDLKQTVTSGVVRYNFSMVNNGTGYDNVLVLDRGNVGIGTTDPAYKLDVSGTIRATGDVIAYSDARVKDNVKTIENAIEKITSLRGVSYTRKDTDDKSPKIGVIAQEVLPIIPEVVSKDQNGNYSVSYGNIVGLLIEAVKEQQKQIDELKYLLKNNQNGN